MNLLRGRAIESPQQSMQRPGTPRFPLREAIAQRLIARRSLEQSVEQRAQVEAGSSGQYRQAAPRRNLVNRFFRQPRKFSRREDLIRVGDIDQVVRNAAPLGYRQLRGPK